MNRPIHTTGLIAAVALCGALAGCAKSLWETEFTGSGDAAPALAGDALVRVRDAPWERVQQALVEIDKEWASSDTHPDDWAQERKTAVRGKLLKALQVPGDPATVEVLGRSEFRTTSRVRPDDGELTDFARRVGATTVVWSSVYIGKADRIVQEPVTEFRTGGGAGRWWGRGGRWRGSAFAESWTVFVPVVVRADEHAYVAFFLRENR